MAEAVCRGWEIRGKHPKKAIKEREQKEKVKKA